jgi:FkbM family methyltransferase
MPSPGDSLASAYGLVRSLLIYYGVPLRGSRLRAFYRQFVRPGDLCFDLGAHVGNRLRALASLGAQVVALEPHPALLQLLQRWYGTWPGVTLLGQAVGAKPGEQTLMVSRLAPTVSSLSPEWTARVARTPGFASVRWDSRVVVPVTTLDRLIAQYGVPAFCKLDVEGSELAALQGLSTPLPALSFEVVPAAVELAVGCLDRLTSLGSYEFNRTRGESTRWVSSSWLDHPAMAAELRALPPDSRSGDVYARRRPVT